MKESLTADKFTWLFYEGVLGNKLKVIGGG